MLGGMEKLPQAIEIAQNGDGDCACRKGVAKAAADVSRRRFVSV
jgi:hypothetical protein